MCTQILFRAGGVDFVVLYCVVGRGNVFIPSDSLAVASIREATLVLRPSPSLCVSSLSLIQFLVGFGGFLCCGCGFGCSPIISALLSGAGSVLAAALDLRRAQAVGRAEAVCGRQPVGRSCGLGRFPCASFPIVQLHRAQSVGGTKLLPCVRAVSEVVFLFMLVRCFCLSI